MDCINRTSSRARLTGCLAGVRDYAVCITTHDDHQRSLGWQREAITRITTPGATRFLTTEAGSGDGGDTVCGGGGVGAIGSGYRVLAA